MKILSRVLSTVLILVMFLSDVPLGVVVDVVEDRNVVDVLWQAYKSGSLDEALGPNKVYAADYDITELTTLEHDTGNGVHNSLVQIDATHYMLAYSGGGSDAFLTTFSMDGSYNVTEIDQIEHDTVLGQFPSLVMIDATKFVLAYSGNGSDGFIKTFSIDGSYDNITLIDSLEHEVTLGQHQSLVMIDSTHFMLAYSGSGSDGYLSTFSVDSNADNITIIDTIEHDTTLGQYNSLKMISPTRFVLAYSGSGSDGFIKTFSIDGSYDNITLIDSLEHDTTIGLWNSTVLIDSTHLLLAYSGPDTGASTLYDGFLKTFSFDGNADNITLIDSLEHDTTLGLYNSIKQIDSNNFLLAYSSTDTGGAALYDGFIKTFSIDGSYDTITEIDSVEHDTTQGMWNDLISISETHYILAYSGNGADGYLTTFNVELPSTFEQSAYRIFDNADSMDVGTALAAQDTAATLTSTGDAFRLRMLIHVAAGQLSASEQNFKLQFAEKSGTCDTGFSGESYADVNGSTVIAYNNNASPADGDNLTANASDPTDGGDTIVNQDYEEANNFTNTVAAVPSGQDGKWDFSLIDNGATANTSYCFRIVESDGTQLDTYSVIPEVIMAASGASGTLTFSISDNTVEFGTLTSSDDTFADNSGGNATEVEAHTITASTNASSGYVITINGTTLTSAGNTITAIGSSNTASSIGTEQFGLRMTAAGGNGSVTTPYAASGFAFDTGSFPDQVASDADGDDVTTTYSVRYLGNIGATTEAGSYSSTLTYVVTAGF